MTQWYDELTHQEIAAYLSTMAGNYIASGAEVDLERLELAAGLLLIRLRSGLAARSAAVISADLAAIEPAAVPLSEPPRIRDVMKLLAATVCIRIAQRIGW